MRINILGSKWKIKEKTDEEDPILETADGYCDHSIKTIVLREMHPDKDSLKDLGAYRKKVLRHEIVHAFLHESGLAENAHTPYSSWAKNEEMVDWIALQGPKLHKAWKDANAL